MHAQAHDSGKEPNEILVALLRARKLPAVDKSMLSKASSDPQVVFRCDGSIAKSTVKKKNLNPIYRERSVGPLARYLLVPFPTALPWGRASGLDGRAPISLAHNLTTRRFPSPSPFLTHAKHAHTGSRCPSTQPTCRRHIYPLRSSTTI